VRILASQYTLNNKAFEIYVAGCSGKPHCAGCHNPESWRFDIGDVYDKDYYLGKIKEKVEEFDIMIDNIMIFGGEPLDNDYNELEFMLLDFKKLKKKIWLFTRYNFNEVPMFVKSNCDYIKCGRYDENLRCDDNIQYGITLATSNQNIYKKGKDY